MANPPAASLIGRQLRFHLKYYQRDLRAAFRFVQIGSCLAGQRRIHTGSSQVHNICCCSQGKIPGEPKQPLGINQSVRSDVCCSDLLLDAGGGTSRPLASLRLLAFGWGLKSNIALGVWEGGWSSVLLAFGAVFRIVSVLAAAC